MEEIVSKHSPYFSPGSQPESWQRCCRRKSELVHQARNNRMSGKVSAAQTCLIRQHAARHGQSRTLHICSLRPLLEMTFWKKKEKKRFLFEESPIREEKSKRKRSCVVSFLCYNNFKLVVVLNSKTTTFSYRRHQYNTATVFFIYLF